MKLAAGWLSAMAQGHGMSVLVRAYLATGEINYLHNAELALNSFAVNASAGGVRNYVFDMYPWYEEYPTRDGGTFVLNGFLYALIGLYDLMVTAKLANVPTNATALFEQVVTN